MARETMTLQAATEHFQQFLQKQGVATDDRYFDLVHGFDHRFGAGLWSDEATVSVLARPASFSRDKDVEVGFEVKVNWSSTRRTVSQAVAALASYREAVELAAHCEAFFQELPRVVVPAAVETEAPAK